MKKTIYLVRHGQTEFNVQKRTQGWKDSPLTKKGIEQAKKVRDYFEKNHILFDHAYASDLKRAMDTMKIIVPDSIIQSSIPGLREMSFGKYDGWRHTDIPIHHGPDFYKKNGGETRKEAIERALQTMKECMEASNHHTVLFVSHGIPVSGIFHSLQHQEGLKDPEDFRNGCIVKIEMDRNDWIVTDFIQTEKEPYHHGSRK